MDQSYMKEKPIVPLVLKMALPMVVSMLVNSMYNIVDSFFVAQIGEARDDGSCRWSSLSRTSPTRWASDSASA